MWSSDLEVVPISCGNCGRNLSGLQNDIIFFCPDCRTAWCLDQEPASVEIAFPVPVAPPDLHLPFWIVETWHEEMGFLVRRESNCSPLEFPRDLDPGAERGMERGIIPAAECIIAVPAFTCDRAAGFGWEITKRLDSMPGGDNAPRALPGGVMARREAFEAAKGVFLASQVSCRPGIASVDLDLRIRRATLAAVGFTLLAHGLQLAGTRLVLPYTAMVDARALIDFLDLEAPSG